MNYYPHHIGDYSAATAHLSWLEDMAYTRLMRIYYQSEKPIPSDRERVYRLTRASTKQERQAVDAVLDEFFMLTDDGYRQSRCDEEIAKMKDKSDKARRSIEARWKNERNTSVSTNEHTNVLRPKNESNTPNSQEPITNNQEPKKDKNKAQAPLLPDWLPRESWDAWLEMRKRKRTPNTEHALSLAVRELCKLRSAGDDPGAVLDQSTARGWTGLFPLKDQGNVRPLSAAIPGERL